MNEYDFLESLRKYLNDEDFETIHDTNLGLNKFILHNRHKNIWISFAYGSMDKINVHMSSPDWTDIEHHIVPVVSDIDTFNVIKAITDRGRYPLRRKGNVLPTLFYILKGQETIFHSLYLLFRGRLWANKYPCMCNPDKSNLPYCPRHGSMKQQEFRKSVKAW